MDSDQIYELAKEFQIKSYDANAIVFKQVRNIVYNNALMYNRANLLMLSI